MDFRLIYFLLLQNLFDDITFDRQCEKGYPFDKENIRTHEKQRRKIMYSDKEFRTVVFGGYNKEDVHEYLQTIEKDSEVAKFGYQNEIKELKTELEENKKENVKLEEIIRIYKKKLEELENKESSGHTQAEIYIEELKKQKRENENLRQKFVKLEAERQVLLENNRSMKEELNKLNAVGLNSEKNMQLEDEIQQMQEEKAKYEEDFQAIRKVLQDARLSAQYIQEEAQKKAEEILNSAKKESRDLIERRKMQIDKELEDRGIRFMAAKYKMEAYRKEINDTQQKLYNLYSDMGKMIEGMPQRLEQLWDEEALLCMSDREDIYIDTDSENKKAESVEK